jgi:hypothetical protein
MIYQDNIGITNIKQPLSQPQAGTPQLFGVAPRVVAAGGLAPQAKFLKRRAVKGRQINFPLYNRLF